MRKQYAALLALLALLMFACAALADLTVEARLHPVTADGWYDTMEEVAVYLASYDRLPGNYITKKEAQNLGWQSSRGNLWQVAKGKSIGGDRFGNYEGLVPQAKGRSWIECDIDFDGGYRNGQRIVYSSDGLIYYTGDHYASFDRVNVVFAPKQEQTKAQMPEVKVEYGECYTGRDEVAAYLHAFGELPINYITKDEAKELGYSAKKDNMGKVAEGFAIGGDEFANKEGLLPKAKGRVWRECDVNIGKDGKRGNCRILYSDDGLIYYTADKYKSFEAIYGE